MSVSVQSPINTGKVIPCLEYLKMWVTSNFEYSFDVFSVILGSTFCFISNIFNIESENQIGNAMSLIVVFFSDFYHPFLLMTFLMHTVWTHTQQQAMRTQSWVLFSTVGLKIVRVMKMMCLPKLKGRY